MQPELQQFFPEHQFFKGALGTWVEKKYKENLFFLSVFNSCSGFTIYFTLFLNCTISFFDIPS